MKREEADAILSGILEGKIDCARPEHFREAMREEGFTSHDLVLVLRSHRFDRAPEWRDEHRAHRVRLAGKCCEGRQTLLVMDLRHEGPCAYVTIMVDNRGRAR